MSRSSVYAKFRNLNPFNHGFFFTLNDELFARQTKKNALVLDLESDTFLFDVHFRFLQELLKMEEIRCYATRALRTINSMTNASRKYEKQ